MIDSHCHIDMPQFDADRDEVIARAREAGLVEMLVVGEVDEGEALRRSLRVAEVYGLPATAGVHPHQARLADEHTYDEIRGLARERRVVAIGEIGLDFHYDYSPRETQREVFRRQIRLARDVGLPIVVHTREADDDTAAMVREAGQAGVGGVLHCFTGPASLAEVALDAGWYLSFSGVVTFRKWTDDVLIRSIPEDRILVESDAPYLAPVPHRGKRNEPAHVALTVAKIAEARGSDAATLGHATVRNTVRLFRLAGVESVP